MKLTEAQARALLRNEKDVQKAVAGACLRELYAGGYPSGSSCRRPAADDSLYCWQHK